MSLINDALKRAHLAQKQRPPVGPLGVPLQPAEAHPAGNWLPVAAVTASLMLALGAAGWLVWFGWQSVRQASAAKATAPSASRAEPSQIKAPPAPATVPTTPPAAASPAVQVNTAPVALSTQSAPPTPVTPNPAPAVAAVPQNPPPAPMAEVPAPVASTPPASPVAVAVPNVPVTAPTPAPAPVKPQFPEVKLQGIFYLSTRPSALISGKTVFIGDQVQGTRVVTIERRSVTLEFDGQTKVLSME